MVLEISRYTVWEVAPLGYGGKGNRPIDHFRILTAGMDLAWNGG